MNYTENRKKNSVHAVADYFLLKVDTSVGDTLSNLKLQKLCYFSQVASLLLRGMPIFDDEIQAWAHGPVVKNLYDRFKKYRWQSIDPVDLRTRPHKDLDAAEMKILESIWDTFSGYSAKRLEDISHEQGPWKKFYTPEKTGGRCSNVISEESILEFYRHNPQPDWVRKINFA